VRILHIDTGAEMRGGQHQVLLLLEALRKADHQPVLLCRSFSPLFNAAVGAGYEVEVANLRNVLLHSGRADIVHAHDARAHTLAAFASRKAFVVSRRVAFPVQRSMISLWKYRRAARYLAVSRFVAGELISAGVPKEKVDVVYDAVNSNGAAAEWSPEFPAITLASEDPQKGRDLVQQAAAMSGIEVVFSNDLTKDLQRASMFVYITRAEGLGSAALLAMSLGVPVIASRVGGLAEVFSDGVSGLYVENDVGQIIRAMRRILSSKALAPSLIENARKRVADCFTGQRLLESTLASYESASAG
jgi:hypothetical protein